MPNPTYIKIATVTVGVGGASSIDFTSIPSTYTDLCLKWSLRNTGTGYWAGASLNSSTSSFSGRFIQGSGSAATSATLTDALTFAIANPSSTTSNTFSNGELYLPNYTGSTNKSMSLDMVQEDNSGTAYSRLTAFLWSNTAAINAISLISGSTSFAQYSSATLYGISKS